MFFGNKNRNENICITTDKIAFEMTASTSRLAEKVSDIDVIVLQAWVESLG